MGSGVKEWELRNSPTDMYKGSTEYKSPYAGEIFHSSKSLQLSSEAHADLWSFGSALISSLAEGKVLIPILETFEDSGKQK